MDTQLTEARGHVTAAHEEAVDCVRGVSADDGGLVETDFAGGVGRQGREEGPQV